MCSSWDEMWLKCWFEVCSLIAVHRCVLLYPFSLANLKFSLLRPLAGKLSANLWYQALVRISRWNGRACRFMWPLLAGREQTCWWWLSQLWVSFGTYNHYLGDHSWQGTQAAGSSNPFISLLAICISRWRKLLTTLLKGSSAFVNSLLLVSGKD